MPGLCVLPDPKRTRRHGGLFVLVIPRCKISPKLNGTAPHFGDEMFALVLFVCYLDGGCEDIVVDVYNTEQQCLHSMSDQRIRQGGCFPIEDFIDGFWRPAQEYGDF
ncbi:protein [Escherichia coli]|uniref:Protein n=7 Tax=Enterobacteriaceae TaxID=543 RepID=A0A2X1N9Y0_ECOLX|nr:protein [Escherichia coli]